MSSAGEIESRWARLGSEKAHYLETLATKINP
jgi:hypothetical protein